MVDQPYLADIEQPVIIDGIEYIEVIKVKKTQRVEQHVPQPPAVIVVLGVVFFDDDGNESSRETYYSHEYSSLVNDIGEECAKPAALSAGWTI